MSFLILSRRTKVQKKKKEYRNKGCQSRCCNYMILNRSCIIIVPFVIIYFVSTPAAAIIADRLTFESSIEKTDTLRRRDHYREMKLRLRTNHAPIYALFSVSSSPPKKSHAFESDKIYRSDVWLNLLV